MHGFTNLHRIPWPKAAEHGEGILVLQFSSLPPLLPSSFHEATLHASQTWRHFCTTHLPFSFSADHDVPEQTKYCTTCMDIKALISSHKSTPSKAKAVDKVSEWVYI